MSYNPWADILILCIAVFALAAATFCLPHWRKPRGATPEPDRKKLKEHQDVRRILMKDGEYH
jgi:hypothetical protein